MSDVKRRNMHCIERWIFLSFSFSFSFFLLSFLLVLLPFLMMLIEENIFYFDNRREKRTEWHFMYDRVIEMKNEERENDFLFFLFHCCLIQLFCSRLHSNWREKERIEVETISSFFFSIILLMDLNFIDKNNEYVNSSTSPLFNVFSKHMLFVDGWDSLKQEGGKKSRLANELICFLSINEMCQCCHTCIDLLNMMKSRRNQY